MTLRQQTVHDMISGPYLFLIYSDRKLWSIRPPTSPVLISF